MNKKGISPVIATMLLVAIVIVIGLIVFLWFRGITEEAVTKFGGTNVKLICEDVSFEADYDGGFIYISNSGNIPIFEIQAKIIGEGTHSTETLIDGWPELGLNQGGTYAGPTPGVGEKIILIPVLMGKTDKGATEKHVCQERHGYEILTA